MDFESSWWWRHVTSRRAYNNGKGDNRFNLSYIHGRSRCTAQTAGLHWMHTQGPFIATQLNSTQLNVELSCGRSDGEYIGIYTPKISNGFVHVWDINTCLKLQWLVKTYDPSQIIFLASGYATGWVELSCVDINGPLDALGTIRLRQDTRIIVRK